MADSADYAIYMASWHGRAALPAGQISSPTGPRNEIGMAGYVWSPKAEIYCVRYRYYDPLLGRWLQRDPAGYIDGLNLYTYGLGNPWMYTDPYGLFVSNPISDWVGEKLGEWISGGDAEYIEMIRGVENAQKDAICQNYHNGNISAEDARYMWGKVNGMADDLEQALDQLAIEQRILILETAIEIATEIGLAITTGGVGNGARYAARAANHGSDVARGLGAACRGAGCRIGGRACFVAGTLVLMASGDLAAIETVELGDRVESAAYVEPLTYGSLEFGYAGGENNTSPYINDYKNIDPEFWRTIDLIMVSDDGGSVEVTLLRPEAWLTYTGADDADVLWLDLPEVGVAGWAEIVSISPAPASIEPGQEARGTVTGRFVTTEAETLDLYLDTSNTSLGVTATHPIWSLDREDWVPAGDLWTSERVATISGWAMVRGMVPAAERTVYNLEVLGEHTYFVGDDGVWVHNTGCSVTFTAGIVSRATGTVSGTAGYIDNVLIESPEALSSIAKQAKTWAQGEGLRTVVVNTGYVVGDLAPQFIRRAESGAQLFGGTVSRIPRGPGEIMDRFIITVPVR